MTDIFHLGPPITLSSRRKFAHETGVMLVEGADLSSLGYAWGEILPQPEAPGKIVEPAEPVLNDGFVTRGWTVRDATPEEIETRRQQAHDQVRAGYSRAMEPLSTAYPPEEREGWAEQVAAAQEVLAGGQNDLIDALRAPTGETAQEMAQAIVAKRQQYLAIYGQITAARRALDAQIAAATTLAEIEAVDIEGGYGL